MTRDQELRKLPARMRHLEDFDENGILRDGRSIRVPLMMRDSSTAAAALSCEDARLATEAFVATQRALADGLVFDALAAHKPGFRYSDRSIQDAAYAESVERISNEWRTKDTYYAEVPQSVREGAQAPKGILPLGSVPKHGTSAKLGEACYQEGATGTWENDGKGNLYCKLKPMARPTVPPTNPSSADSISAADGQRLKDAAYEEYVRDITNAWRSPNTQLSTADKAPAVEYISEWKNP
jgi:hypothetical protein